jgi:hypothetical protein
MLVKLYLGGLLVFCLLASLAVWAAGLSVSGGFPAPQGLQPCPPGDPLSALETSIAAKLGGAYLGCFRSPPTAPLPGVAAPMMSGEQAFAISLPGRDRGPADLANLLATVRQQWKDFDPLSKEFKDSYVARLNGLIKENGSSSLQSVVSIHPILVSIDEGDGRYYTVTTIRTYVVESDGRQITLTKVNADAVALQGSQLVRLTIQRVLRDPGDVAQVKGEIAGWAQATTTSVAPTTP